MYRTSKFLMFCALAALLLTTVPPAAFAQSNTQAAACEQTYIVQKGDWLSTIAQKFLGDVTAYPAILQATNDAAKSDSSFAALTDPNKIEVGQKLCIPPITSVPGRELAGIYTTVGPAADASALVETLVLGGDGQVRYTLDYIGKATIDAKGTWKQEGDTVTVQLYEQAGKATKQTMTFTVQDGNLVATTPPNATYTKTSPDIAFYAGLYTTNRASADGSETLTALALLPNGQAQLTSSSTSNPFILQTGAWTAGKNADTGAPSITVNLTKQNDQAINETYVFQADSEKLRGTAYNKDKWGTDLTFTKYHAPAEPETPASVNSAEFGGVSFRFDPQLAKSAQGETTKAVPVTEGPALGGATPASIRFLFNGEKAPEFMGPNVAQVNVYKTDDWVKLDPSTLLPSDYKTALGAMTDEEWSKQYTQYLEKLVKDLEGLNPASYTPNLTLTEEIVKSIEISDTTLQ